MKELLKKALPDILAILAFIVISVCYFSPAIPEGRILAQHDMLAGVGAGEEARAFKEETGKTTRWTNALFSGMPTYQLSPSYPSSQVLTKTGRFYQLFLPSYIGLVFIMLLGFYILMRAFNFSVWLSALGAILWAFSSYYFILIVAGHIWKFVTLAYIPPTIAGLVLAYRGKYLWGGLLTAIFFALQIISNHIQMTYYFMFLMLFMVIGFFVDAYQKKELPRFFKASAVLLVAFSLGALMNISSLYHTYDYSKHTMRGKSELVKPNSADQTDSGLERSYITAWSYGIGETFTLMIPNVKGGASVPLGANEVAMEKANQQYVGLYNQMGQYWGEQPGTSGPVYVGAFVCFLFILGCFIVKGPIKWALVAGTLFSILLSWGHNFMGLTDFFIDYVPMYSKFRTVASILVVAEFTIPLLALFALKRLLEEPELIKSKVTAIAFAGTAGLTLLFALLPGLFFPNYVSSSEMTALQGALPAEHLQLFIANLTEIRQSIFTTDAWRSFFIILIGGLCLYLYGVKKIKGQVAVLLILVLCLIDLWTVDKRYLNDDHFIAKKSMNDEIPKTPTDDEILKDTSLNYRVLNLATNTFNENNTSYWHKSIGGYHAAKLRRYQEMIEYHLSTEMSTLYQGIAQAQGDIGVLNPDSFAMLNMLNAKYIIMPVQGGTFPLQNPHALGNAWFVDEVKYVDTPNEEIETLYGIDPQVTAVVSASNKNVLDGVTSLTHDSLATITLTAYEPNHLVYETSSSEEQVVVFSEINYPGWHAYIDQQEVPHTTANYVLRTMKLPAGKHQVEFVFDPRSIHVTESVATGSFVVLLLCLGGVIFWEVRRRKKKASASDVK